MGKNILAMLQMEMQMVGCSNVDYVNCQTCGAKDCGVDTPWFVDI